jgi:protocatechuate 3,4-dioxygenase beta subunit
MQMAAIQVEDGETTVLNLPVQQGSIRVRGVVRKGRTPVEGRLFWARVAPDGATLEDLVAGLSDGSGAYEVRLNGPGNYDVRIQPKEPEDPMDMGVLLKVEVADEPEITHDLIIPEIALSGVVIDGDTGLPLRGTRVLAVPLEEDGSERERDDIASAAEADEEGRYRIEGIDPGVYRLVFSKEGYGEDFLDAVEVDEDDEREDLDVALRTGHPVTFRVVDSSGNPVEGAFIMPLEFSVAWFGSGGQTGIDGSLVVKGLREGTHDVGVIARAWAPAVLRDVVVGPGGDSRVKVKLRRGGGLALHVVGLEDEPVAGATIHVREEEGPDLTRLFRVFGAVTGTRLTTNARGELTLAHLEPGRYEISVRGGGLTVSETVRIRGGRTSEIEVALR